MIQTSFLERARTRRGNACFLNNHETCLNEKTLTLKWVSALQALACSQL